MLAARPGGFPALKVLGDRIVAKASTGEHRRIGGDDLLRFCDHLKHGGGLSAPELAATGIPADMHLGWGHWAIASADGGTTWADVGDPLTATFLDTCETLRDGTSICLYCFSIQTPGREELLIWRSRDAGATWSGPEAAEVIGPRHADTGWDNPYLGGTFYGGIEEIADGSLLLFGHTRFLNDHSGRVVVYRSLDQARSFHYYATVAYAHNSSTTLRPLGFNEPGALQLEDGELLCFMRTAEYEPIFLSRSQNEGRTWSPPERVGVDGILPTPVCLQNGVLALSYGRPGVWITFSADRGQWWTDRKCIWAWHSLWGEGHLPATPHYTAPGYATYEYSDCNARIAEIAPNRLLLVYSAPAAAGPAEAIDIQDAGGRSVCSVWGVTIDVRLT
jgi:hypothetical protein